MAQLKRSWMQAGNVGLALAIAEILARELADGLAGMPRDPQPGMKEQPVTLLSQPVVELVVLVCGQPFVPTAKGSAQRHRVGTEGHVVDLLGLLGVVVPRVPDAKP